MSPRWCSMYWTPSCEEVMLLDEEAVDACISRLWRQISEQLASRHDATSLFFPTKTKQQIKKEMKRKGTRVLRSGIYLFFLKRMLVHRQRSVRFLWQFSTTHLYSEIGDGGWGVGEGNRESEVPYPSSLHSPKLPRPSLESRPLHPELATKPPRLPQNKNKPNTRVQTRN